MSEHTIKIEVNSKLHTREPESESERQVWAVLDTAWDLLREYAVRVTLQEIREANPGVFPATDEELFDSVSGVPGAPKSYADLACQAGDSEFVDLAALSLSNAFDMVLSQSRIDAMVGLDLQVPEGE